MRRFELLRNVAEGGGAAGGGAEGAPPAAEPTPAAPTGAITAPEGTPPAEGTKPAEGAPPAPTSSPLTFETLKFSEGVTVDKEAFQPVLDLFNDDKLDGSTRVSKLADLHAKALETAMKSAEEKLASDWIAAQEAARKAIMSDPEIGGANFDTTRGLWNNVLNEFGTVELRQELDRTGMGNSLELGRFLAKIGRVMAEGKPVVGAPTSANAGKSAAERLYPNQGKV